MLLALQQAEEEAAEPEPASTEQQEEEEALEQCGDAAADRSPGRRGGCVGGDGDEKETRLELPPSTTENAAALAVRRKGGAGSE